MRFTHELTYDAPPADVRRMLADPAFRQRVCDAMRSVRTEVSIADAGAGLDVVVDQTQPARGIPAFARSVVGDEVRVVQRETWTDASGGSFTVEIPGKPAAFTGTVALAAEGAGTVQTVTGDVKVKIPMLGGRLEGLVGDMLRAALQTEHRVGRAWLAGDR
jgi:uncharacterized Zn-binding protein involved in type VI secretion